MTKTNNHNLVKKVFSILALLILALVFIFLGLWQWERAQAHQRLQSELEAISNLPVVALQSIHEPSQALSGESVNRRVSATGLYRALYRANNQLLADGRRADLEVALFEVSSQEESEQVAAQILVAREIIEGSWPASDWNEVEFGNRSTRFEITGRLLPSQSQDSDPFARQSEEVRDLARIDSALLTARSNAPLYDGYILLFTERSLSPGSADVGVMRNIPDRIAEPTIPGYYWQHIAYVFIWFLMAAITLYLPFYQRQRSKILSDNDNFNERKSELR